MMKKFLLITLILLCVCGCGKDSWENKIQVSTLKFEDNHIIGKIKNLTDKAYELDITFEVKSGSLVDDEFCYETIKPNETIDFECLTYNVDETYTFKIKDIKLEEFEIPELKAGKLDYETFEYHFEDIEEQHRLNFISFTLDIEDSEYPYIEEIDYLHDKLEIYSEIQQDENLAHFYETYNSNTDELESLRLIISGDDDFLNETLTDVSLMQSISNSSGESLSVNRALLRKDIESGYCVKIYDWCISTDYSNDFVKSFIIRKN